MPITKNKILKISISAETDIGKERSSNEDCAASLQINVHSFNKELNCGIIVIADGMGGHDCGEVASELASKKFLEVIVQNLYFSSKNGKNVDFNDILIKSVESANSEVWKISRNYNNRIGTTLVGAILIENRVYIVNVGDSRAYLINPKKSICQITKDHTVVQEMVDANMITTEQAKIHPRRNIITKALGLSEHVVPDLFEREINDQTLLLCSDGLYGMVEDDEIKKAVNGNIFKITEKLINLANIHGGHDNISVAIAKIR
jgi:PPM family protein phosphatase